MQYKTNPNNSFWLLLTILRNCSSQEQMLSLCFNSVCRLLTVSPDQDKGWWGFRTCKKSNDYNSFYANLELIIAQFHTNSQKIVHIHGVGTEVPLPCVPVCSPALLFLSLRSWDFSVTYVGELHLEESKGSCIFKIFTLLLWQRWASLLFFRHIRSSSFSFSQILSF